MTSPNTAGHERHRHTGAGARGRHPRVRASNCASDQGKGHEVPAHSQGGHASTGALGPPCCSGRACHSHPGRSIRAPYMPMHLQHEQRGCRSDARGRTPPRVCGPRTVQPGRQRVLGDSRRGRPQASRGPHRTQVRRAGGGHVEPGRRRCHGRPAGRHRARVRGRRGQRRADRLVPGAHLRRADQRCQQAQVRVRGIQVLDAGGLFD